VRIVDGYDVSRMDSLVEAIQRVEKVRQTLMDNLIHEHNNFVASCSERGKDSNVCSIASPDMIIAAGHNVCCVTNCPHLQRP